MKLFMLKEKIFKKNKGVTLVELLVAIVIFSIVIVAITGIFVSIIRVQRYTLLVQQLLDQTGYLAEYMSRSIRMAKKDTLPDCLLTIGNYEISSQSERLKFKNYNQECLEFFKNDNNILSLNLNDGKTFPLHSEKFKTSFLEFRVQGDEKGEQPRVTFSLKIEGINQNLPQPSIRLQSTISQRDLNIELRR